MTTKNGVIYLPKHDASLIIRIYKCNFTLNEAIGGYAGALSFIDLVSDNIDIWGNHFGGNMATYVNLKGGHGGAIMITTQNSSLSEEFVCRISSNSFIYNHADRFGGAVYSINKPPDMVDNEWLYNTASD